MLGVKLNGKKRGKKMTWFDKGFSFTVGVCAALASMYLIYVMTPVVLHTLFVFAKWVYSLGSSFYTWLLNTSVIGIPAILLFPCLLVSFFVVFGKTISLVYEG